MIEKKIRELDKAYKAYKELKEKPLKVNKNHRFMAIISILL